MAARGRQATGDNPTGIKKNTRWREASVVERGEAWRGVAGPYHWSAAGSCGQLRAGAGGVRGRGPGPRARQKYTPLPPYTRPPTPPAGGRAGGQAVSELKVPPPPPPPPPTPRLDPPDHHFQAKSARMRRRPPGVGPSLRGSFGQLFQRHASLECRVTARVANSANNARGSSPFK